MQEFVQKQSNFLEKLQFLEFSRCEGQSGSKLKMTPPPLRLSATNKRTYGIAQNPAQVALKCPLTCDNATGLPAAGCPNIGQSKERTANY